MRVSLFFALFGLTVISVRAQAPVPAVSRVIPMQTLAPGGQAVTLNLGDFFTLPDVTGQIVRFDTVMGKFDVELRADAAPREVANFLNYVRSGRYNSSFFHRSAVLDASGAIGIVQGGGFTVNAAGQYSVIPADAPVPLEYNLPNERGTIAAARTGDPNSATSQWYFNVRDNTSILGASNGGGYTVFGRVLGAGMTVVDAIAALPRVDARQRDANGNPDLNDPFGQLPLRNYTSGPITYANFAIVNSITPISLFPSGSTPGAFSFSATSSAPSIVAVSVTGSTLTLTPVGAGNATITVQATDVGGNAISSTFAVAVATTTPAITVQPVSQTIATGSTVVFSGAASAANTYQWQRNGTDLAGATNSTLVVGNASVANAGTYTLVARNPNGSVTSSAANLAITTAAASDVGRLVNLSIRSAAGVGDQTVIVGFGLGGSGTSGSAPLLLRAIGPSLSQFGLMNALSDPVATVYQGKTIFATNDNWGGDVQIENRRAQVGAFSFISSGSLDAAFALSPLAGSYTMAVTGNGNANGTALAEIYDASMGTAFTATTPRLINVSARTQVSTGDNVLIAGFVIRGTTAKTVLIRGAGPALQRFGVNGVLANPKLQLGLQGAANILAENDDWGGDPQIATVAKSVGAFAFLDGSSTDSALLVTLPPGNYTAKVFGADGGTGVALIEVYEVQ